MFGCCMQYKWIFIEDDTRFNFKAINCVSVYLFYVVNIKD